MFLLIKMDPNMNNCLAVPSGVSLLWVGADFKEKKYDNILSVKTLLTGKVKEHEREVQVSDPCPALAL